MDATNVGAYFAEIERERARALSAYGLLLVPGLELTYNHPNPDRAGHAVAVELCSFVAMDEGPAAAMEQAGSAGAAILAAHPHDWGPTPGEQDEKALVDYLRSPRSVFLTRLEQPPVALAAPRRDASVEYPNGCRCEFAAEAWSASGDTTSVVAAR